MEDFCSAHLTSRVTHNYTDTHVPLSLSVKPTRYFITTVLTSDNFSLPLLFDWIVFLLKLQFVTFINVSFFTYCLLKQSLCRDNLMRQINCEKKCTTPTSQRQEEDLNAVNHPHVLVSVLMMEKQLTVKQKQFICCHRTHD